MRYLELYENNSSDSFNKIYFGGLYYHYKVISKGNFHHYIVKSSDYFGSRRFYVSSSRTERYSLDHFIDPSFCYESIEGMKDTLLTVFGQVFQYDGNESNNALSALESAIRAGKPILAHEYSEAFIVEPKDFEAVESYLYSDEFASWLRETHGMVVLESPKELTMLNKTFRVFLFTFTALAGKLQPHWD